MAEGEGRQRLAMAPRDFSSVQVDVEGDLAERDHHFQVGQQFQFPLEVGTAVAQSPRAVGLLPGGAQWAAAVMYRPWSVSPSSREMLYRLGGEAGLVEDAVKDVAGAVAGEHAAGTVGAVGAGRESQNQDAGARGRQTGTGRPQYSWSR